MVEKTSSESQSEISEAERAARIIAAAIRTGLAQIADAIRDTALDDEEGPPASGPQYLDDPAPLQPLTFRKL